MHALTHVSPRADAHVCGFLCIAEVISGLELEQDQFAVAGVYLYLSSALLGRWHGMAPDETPALRVCAAWCRARLWESRWAALRVLYQRLTLKRLILVASTPPGRRWCCCIPCASACGCIVGPARMSRAVDCGIDWYIHILPACRVPLWFTSRESYAGPLHYTADRSNIVASVQKSSAVCSAVVLSSGLLRHRAHSTSQRVYEM